MDTAQINLSVFLCVAGCLLLTLGMITARMRRKARLSRREALSLDVWIARFYSKTDVSPKAVEITLNAFGEAYGIEPTRLRPTDRIDDDLRDSLCGLFPDSELDVVEVFIESAMRDEGVEVDWASSLSRCATVDAIIRALSLQLGTVRER